MVAWLKKVLGFLGQLIVAIAHFVFESFTHYDEVVADVNHIVHTWSAIKLNIEREVGKIRQFKFDPHWKTRVINVPQAAEQIQDLKAMLFEDWKDRVDKVVAPVHELTLVLRQERAPEVGDPQGAVNAMSKASVKLGHVVTMIHQVRDALDEVQSFVELFDKLRENLESLDSIFLPQGSSKTTVTETYRKRNA
jgi:hypothetical protein